MRTLIRRSLLSPGEGANSTTCIATDPRLSGVTGRYFDRDREASTPPVSHDPTTQQRLLALSQTHFAG
jgi:hypothetical protein